MNEQEKKKFLNKKCKITYEHICCDGSRLIRTLTVFVDDVKKLDDDRIVRVVVING